MFSSFMVFVSKELLSFPSGNTWISRWSDGVVSTTVGMVVYFGITVISAFNFLAFIYYRIVMGQNAARKLHMECQVGFP